MKKIFIFLLLILSSTFVFGQTKNSFVKSTIKYTIEDGYKINDPSYVTYDALGWLWIAGRSAQKNQFTLENNEYIIQRFDGVNFYDVKLPEFEHKVAKLWMLDYHNSGFVYLHVQYANNVIELYKIHTSSLEFSKIEAYSSLSKYRKYGHFVLNNTLFFMFGKGTEVNLYKLENDTFVRTDTGTIDANNFHLDPYFSPYQGKFSIVNFPPATSFFIDNQGTILKKLTKDDYATKNSKEEKTFLNHLFIHNDTSYFRNSNKDIFKLDEQNLKFEQTKPLKDFSNSNGFIVFYLHKNDKFVYVDKNQSSYKVKYVDLKDNPKLLGEIEVPHLSSLNSKNLNKELIIFYQNTLEYVQLNQSIIETYFKEESIRTVKEVATNEYIVSTDIKGFFKLNTLDNTQEKIQITQNGKEFPIEFPRDIIPVGDTYIFNDHYNLYKVNKKYKTLETYPLDKLSEEVIKIGDTIFKGSLSSEGLYKFSLDSKKHYKVEGVTDYIREFATDSKKLYAVSINQGLLEYDNGKTSFYIPENEDPTNLLAINFDSNYGVLVTTKHGKVYHFDTKNKRFKLFYEDALKSSIVGIVSDTTKVAWMNTYAGILAYDPVTKFEKRYTKKDGIYELEGNRYSTTIDSKGNIFMGTLNGLNYFNPYELKKSSTTVDSIQLHFGSLSFFDMKNDQWETKTQPAYLNSLKTITLPPYNRRFNAKVAVANVINHSNYNYRYRLVNDSEEELPAWNKLKIENEIQFPSLSSGNYTLQVEILNSIDKKIGETLELKVLSQQIFYKTWWFMLALFFGIIAIFAFLLYQFKSRQRLLTENQIAIKESKVKEAMMLEIHHRIKNNLQVISGLLSLQAFNSDNQELKDKLKDSQSRIDSIAGIHNILYSSDNYDSVYLEDHFNKIISYHKTLFPISVTYQLDIIAVHLQMDKAIPLALILNELINNSYKHAFTNTNAPEIQIAFSEENGTYVFEYTDNGNFDKDAKKEASMGMKIIGMMCKQLKGTAEIKESTSFNYSVKFPKE